MEFSFLSPTFSQLAITLIAIVLIKLFVAVYRQQTYWRNKGVPYIKSVPFLGSTWRLCLGRTTYADELQFIYNCFPNARYFGTMDFHTPNIVIRDPELIREVAIKSFKHFTDHRTFVDIDIEPLFSRSLFALRGNQWRETRNVLSPSFTANKMSFMFELVSKCSQEFVDHLYHHLEVFSSIEIREAFTRYTTDVIATVAFGLTVNSLKDPDNEFYTTGTNIFDNGGIKPVKILLHRVSPRLSKWLGLTLFPTDSIDYFRKVIFETLRARDEQGIVRPDMLHLLKTAKDTEKFTNPLTFDDIVIQAFTFFLAGFDTVSSAVCQMAYELALNQDVQKKLRDEVDRYMKEENGDISYETLTKMQYMDQVVSETLRMHPPILMLNRLCVEEFELPPAEPGCNSVTVRPGEAVFIPNYAIHRDPKYFPDPERFNPERFSEENKDSINPYAYLPFGVGPRRCIGNRLALMEVKILMVHLLHRFVLKRTEKTQVPLVYKKFSILAAPVKGYWIGLEKRLA